MMDGCLIDNHTTSLFYILAIFLAFHLVTALS